MAAIIDSIERSASAAALGATTSMHNLVVVDLPAGAPPIEVIIVHAPSSLEPPAQGNVRIEHLSHTGRNDSIERPSREAVGLFWRFVLEKWGIAWSGSPSQTLGLHG